MDKDEHSFGRRGLHAAIGALAGVSIWLLFDHLARGDFTDRIVGATSSFTLVFFSATLLMGGTLRFRLGASYAAGLALVSTALFMWASLRFVGFHDFLTSAHPVLALGAMVTLTLPFILAHETAPRGVRDYACLFDNAWTIFVKATAAGVFLGAFWLVILLAISLFDLVGLTFLEDLVRIEWVSAGLSGMVWGLALGVLSDLRGVVVTLRWVALGLLRLLMPLVAVVSAIFIVMVPIRGLEGVFSGLSAAGVLMGVAVLAISLVTSVVDGDDEHGSQAPWMHWFVRLQIATLPIVSGLAFYAVWLRVSQYGWTRPRLVAFVAAAVLLGYALGYVASMLAGRNWRGWLRQVNGAMACLLIGLAALWLTPVLNAERIVANSQANRVSSGLTQQADFPGRMLESSLGKAGRRALERLSRLDFGDWRDQAVADALAGQFSTRRQIEQPKPQVPLSDLVRVVPESGAWPQGLDGALSTYQTSKLRGKCTEIPPGRPPCILLMGSFGGARSTIGYLLFMDHRAPRLNVIELRQPQRGQLDVRDGVSVLRGFTVEQLTAAMTAAQEGDFDLVTPDFKMLKIGDISIWSNN